MVIKKRKVFTKIWFLLLLLFFGVFTPITLSSCIKASQEDRIDDDIKNRENFFNKVINNTSYHFSFNKDNDFSLFDPKNDYSIIWKYKKNKIDELQKQQKIFLKFNFLKKFYLEEIGQIFCLPLITKIDKATINENIKNYQKEIFEFPIEDFESPIEDNDKKNDDNKIEEIIIEFTKKKLEDVNKITNFAIGQNEYEIIFIVSIFNKSLSFESIDDLEKQKNNNGMKNVNIFLHLKLEKNNN